MNEKLDELLQNKWVTHTGVGVLAFAAGVGVTMGIEYAVKNGLFEKAKHAIMNKTEEIVDEVVPPKLVIVETESEDLPPADEPKGLAFSFTGPYTVDWGDGTAPIDEDEIDILDPALELPKPDPKTITVDHVQMHRYNQLVDQYVPKNIALDISLDHNEYHKNSERTEEYIRSNVFEQTIDGWNYADEVATRSPDRPYVIHRDEFWNEEKGYDQSTLNYYAGDDIMTDSDDTPIYNYQNTVGELLFGHGSGDKNVFFVRNEKLKSEYEIIRDMDSFSSVVLGMDLDGRSDLKHSTRKFRLDE